MLSSSSLHSADATCSNDTTSTTTGSWPQDANSRHRVMERCIVPLSSSSYKGSSGRVGILGGSRKYTGAPYYAAIASLKVGADIAFCFCAEEAAVPIKSYSPELMVVPVYKASEFDEAVHQQQQHQQQDNGDKETEQLVKKMVEEVCFMMDKMHVLVLGPGLGRCPLVLEATARIIQKAQSEFHLPLVIDADALFLLTLPKYRNNLLSNDSSVVLTPNAMELKRFRENNNNTTYKFPKRCLIIEKGAVDIIRQANSALSGFNNHSTDIQADNHSDSNTSTSTIMKCDEVGGLKRSGGIGDILAGTVGIFVVWNNILTNQDKATYDDLPLSCWTACCVVKQATKVAFDIHRRSMTAPDIIQELGPVIDRMTTTE